jgi:hypothetical protein
MYIMRFPRRRYAQRRTPIQRLALDVDDPTIYIKRDDQLDLTGHGNKTHKLEFLSRMPSLNRPVGYSCDSHSAIGLKLGPEVFYVIESVTPSPS